MVFLKYFRKNDRQAICLLYAASVVAASLSIAVASMQYAEEVSFIINCSNIFVKYFY